MKALLLPLLLLGTLATAEAQSQVQQDLRQAWQADSALQRANLTEQEAEAVFQAAQRSWWPVLSLDSPALGAATGTPENAAVTATVSAVLSQKLPGGGSVTVGGSQTVTRESIEGPVLTLGLTQPLFSVGPDPHEDRLVAALEKEKALRDLWVTVVRRAANLDNARFSRAARQAALTAAEARAAGASQLEAQGRITKSDSWKASREADSARWLLDKATVELSAQEQAWTQRTGRAAAEWSVDELRAWGAESWPNEASVEETLAQARERQQERAAQLARAAWAPVLSASTRALKPDDQPWNLSGQVGLRWSTDALILGPVSARQAEAAQARRERAEQEARLNRVHSRQKREALEGLLSGYLDKLGAELERQTGLAREARVLADAGSLPAVDRAEAEAEAAQVLADYRQLLWERILVRWDENETQTK